MYTSDERISICHESEGGIENSRTPDGDFRCYNPCEIFLSHTPVPALGKDINEQPHVCHTSIRDVIVLLK